MQSYPPKWATFGATQCSAFWPSLETTYGATQWPTEPVPNGTTISAAHVAAHRKSNQPNSHWATLGTAYSAAFGSPVVKAHDLSHCQALDAANPATHDAT